MIPYHGTPMYPADDMARAFRGRHAMVSYAHREQMEVCAEICQSVALDNGAFSVWKSGASFDYDGYYAWAARWLSHPAVDWCVIPDVIDGTETQNDAYVWNWPLPRERSVPVYHLHESLDRLPRLMGSFDRIALGSSGAYADVGAPQWWARMSEIMRIVCDSSGRPKAKLHGLRMLDPGVFSKLPLSSADSCNVARNVGLDDRWRGPYLPHSRSLRALILMDRIEHHASMPYWSKDAVGAYQNMELFG